jgi:hypothetical protein
LTGCGHDRARTINRQDGELLRRYAADRSHDAFAALVHRHADLVWSSALRLVGGDRHTAEDVAQIVFTALAVKGAEAQARRHSPRLAPQRHTLRRRRCAQSRAAAQTARKGSGNDSDCIQPTRHDRHAAR